MLAQGLGCLHDEVVRRVQAWIGTHEFDLVVRDFCDTDGVAQTNGLHHSHQSMIPISPLPQNVKCHVDLRIRLNEITHLHSEMVMQSPFTCDGWIM